MKKENKPVFRIFLFILIILTNYLEKLTSTQNHEITNSKNPNAKHPTNPLFTL
jgi:hypothetical protein